jgi:hypothetical protein
MPSRLLLLVFLAGCACCTCETSFAEPPERTTGTSIAALMAQLGSDRFHEREAASEALEMVGAPAVEALRRATTSEDQEIRRRAVDLVQKIEKRMEAANLLAGRRFHLVYKDVSIPAAVADFVKQTGSPLQLDPGTAARLSGRKITLDSGEVAYWGALDQLCQKAGLVESIPVPVPQPVIERTADAVMVVNINGTLANHTTVQRPAALVEGRPRALPSCDVGAVRIRLLPLTTPLLGHSKNEGEILFGLDVTAEPQVQWQGVIGMRILKAIDDKGLGLTQPNLYIGEAVVPDGALNALVLDSSTRFAGAVARDPRQVPVHLKLAKTPSKMLRELTGIVAAQVQTPPRPLIVVDNILKAAGKTTKSSHGDSLQVLEVEQQANGQRRLHIQLESSADAFAVGNRLAMIGGGVLIGEPPLQAGPGNLSLQDATGQPFQLAKVLNDSIAANGNRFIQNLTLTYQPQKGQGEAARLVFTGTRAVIIEVPFTLRDVPLP